MNERQKTGAALVAGGIVLIVVSAWLADAEPETQRTPWRDLYDASGAVIGGPTVLSEPAATSSQPAAAPGEWNPTPDELYGSE